MSGRPSSSRHGPSSGQRNPGGHRNTGQPGPSRRRDSPEPGPSGYSRSGTPGPSSGRSSPGQPSAPQSKKPDPRLKATPGSSSGESGDLYAKPMPPPLRPPKNPKIPQQFRKVPALSESQRYTGHVMPPNPLFGVDQNFVLITERLVFRENNYAEDPVEFLTMVMNACFCIKPEYTKEIIQRQLLDLQSCGWLPGPEIRLPGEWLPEHLEDVSRIWLDSKLAGQPEGTRLSLIFAKYGEGPPDYKAFLEDGKIIPSPVSGGQRDAARSIKYIATWLDHYGFEHWPEELKDRVFNLYKKRKHPVAANIRDYSNFEVMARIGRDLQRANCITDENSVATYLWLKIRDGFLDQYGSEIREGTEYFFSKLPPPFAGRYNTFL